MCYPAFKVSNSNLVVFDADAILSLEMIIRILIISLKEAPKNFVSLSFRPCLRMRLVIS